MLAAGWGGWLPLESGKLRAPGGDGHLQHVGQPEKEKTPGDTQGSFSCLSLVGRRGFEPLISALRGRCPGPLDERPTHVAPDPSAHERVQPNHATKPGHRL